MRTLFALPLVLIGSAGSAHPGHIETLAGHDHWVAGAAIGLAIALGLYGALKGNKKADEATDDDQQPAGEEAGA